MSRWARGIERKWSPFPQATRQYGRLDRFPSPYQRSFSQIASSRLPRKGSQDRNSIDTEATEYSKSGTDDQAARQEDAAFDPSKTTPEEAKEKAGEGTGPAGNPLEVSPANPEVSKQRPEQEGGAEKAPEKGPNAPQSGGASPNKAKKVG